MTSNSKLPKDFLFGVATAGFQIEGGYNGPNEPANNWQEWESLGKVEPSGLAIDFWNRYEEYIELAKSLGINAFRLSIEWARCIRGQKEIDENAVEKYVKILESLKNNSLEPVVTLHHFCHPAFLGQNFWTTLEAPDIFGEWVKFALQAFGSLVDKWVTINEPNIFAIMAYIFGQFPPGKLLDTKSAHKAIINLYLAHIKAYEILKSANENATIGINSLSLSIYELDRIYLDILLAKKDSVKESELKDYLEDRRARYYDSIGSYGRFEEFSRKVMKLRTKFNPLELYKRVLQSDFDNLLDVIQIDFYNPIASNHVRFPGHKTAGGRNYLPARMLWDDLVNPELFVTFMQANYEKGLPLWVVENGMATRVKNGRNYERLDGWDRPRFIENYLPKLLETRAKDIDVKAYFHWTLADNYEWGSYEPRFGIFGIDRARGLKILQTDAAGYDAAKAYKTMIAQLRHGK
jgi:beta-glucosidase